MRFRGFKIAIESEYKMSLQKLLYKICVIEELNAVEGAKKLGVAKVIFVYWRHYYRFEEKQRLFDQTIKELIDQPPLYHEKIKSSIQGCNSIA